MGSNSDYEYWMGRWSSLRTVICNTIQSLAWADGLQEENSISNDKKIKNIRITRAKSIKLTLESLLQFGEHHFTFFLNGFFGEKNVFTKSYLLDNSLYPKEFALDSLLKRIQFDFLVLRSALNLRELNGYDLKELKSKSAILSLSIADSIAQLSLNLPIKLGLINNTVSLSYLKNNADIRLVPYAPIMLIGIPIEIIAEESILPPKDTKNVQGQNTRKNALNLEIQHSHARAWMSIPHEVGHFLFSNIVIDNERFADRLRNEFSAKPAWVGRWLEEIFADVYGTLVGGPFYVYSYIRLFQTKTFSGKLYDNGIHPIPILRIYIHRFVLELLHRKKIYQSPLSIKELFGEKDNAGRWNTSSNWDDLMKDFKNIQEFRLFSGTILTKDEYLKEIEGENGIINTILRKLFDDFDTTFKATVEKCWSSGPLTQENGSDQSASGESTEAGRRVHVQRLLGTAENWLKSLTLPKIEIIDGGVPNPCAEDTEPVTCLEVGKLKVVSSLYKLPRNAREQEIGFTANLKYVPREVVVVEQDEQLCDEYKKTDDWLITLGRANNYFDYLTRKIIEDKSQLTKYKLSPDVWLPILRMDGWNTSGDDIPYIPTDPED